MSGSCNTSTWPAEFPPFHPRRWLTNGHLQTVAGNFLPRKNTLPEPVAELVEVCPARGTQIASRILCECHWQPSDVRAERPTVLILHGLEGSSNSQYVVGNANKFWNAGCNVIRMNMRNCGGAKYETAKLTPTLYHSGLSKDVKRVMEFFLEREHLQCISLIGYSMGGNLVLKLAGELGDAAPPQLTSVVGVSPVIDLAPSVDALHEPWNRLYERKFLRALLRRFRRKAALFPRAFDPQIATGISSVREFDNRITALYSGFQSADDYYFRAAAACSIASPSPRCSSTPATIHSSASFRRPASSSKRTPISRCSKPNTAATAHSSPAPTAPMATTATGPSTPRFASFFRTLGEPRTMLPCIHRP